MKRDGTCTSLWQDTVTDFIPLPQEINNRVFDVIIVGGGITGITTGLQLQKSGKSCLVAEAHNICFGTTGGTTAHINTFFDTAYHDIKNDFGEDNAQLVAKATKLARTLYNQNIKAYNIDCDFQDKDGFVYAQTEGQVEELKKMFDASRDAGVAVSYSDTIPVPLDFKKAIVYGGQAQIHPTRYTHALAKEFEKLGGVILDNCTIDKFDESDGVTNIQSNRDLLKARNLIYATHIPPGVNLLHFRCAPYRSYAVAVALKDDN